MKIKPRNNLVLVELLKADVKTPGGVFIPDSVQIGPSIGKIVDMGPDAKSETNPLAIGDRVLVPMGYGSSPLNIEGKEHRLLKTEDILAQVEEV